MRQKNDACKAYFTKVKTIRVVAAIIKSKNSASEPIIFATQRGYGDFKGGWEFPGGKIEPGETPAAALQREIMEELGAEILVGDLIDTVEYDYPTFHLSMDCFWAEVIFGELILKEHQAACWLTKAELDSVAWLPADITLVEKIKRMMWVTKVIVLLVVFGLVGGLSALKTLGDMCVQLLWFILKFFWKDIIKNIIFKPYNIVGMIIAIASVFAVVFSPKEKKVLYAVVSIVVLLSNFVGTFFV